MYRKQPPLRGVILQNRKLSHSTLNIKLNYYSKRQSKIFLNNNPIYLRYTIYINYIEFWMKIIWPIVCVLFVQVCTSNYIAYILKRCFSNPNIYIWDC